ncbi:MAG: T9SS type A sorting domain-containing protein [bacterium]
MGGAHGNYTTRRNTNHTCKCKDTRKDNGIPGHKAGCHNDNFHYACKCVPKQKVESEEYFYYSFGDGYLDATNLVHILDPTYTRLRVGINLQNPYATYECWAEVEGMPVMLQPYHEGALHLNTNFPADPDDEWFSFYDPLLQLDGLPEGTELAVHYIIPGNPEEIVQTFADVVAGEGDMEETGWCGWSDVQLPVELTAFWAEESYECVTLHWTTASEQSTDRFRIYRALSTDGPWNLVHEERGHGTTSESHDYSWSDSHVMADRTYWYLLADVDFSGAETRHENRILHASASTPSVPYQYALYQNRPNPFNPTTEIVYELQERGHVTLKVFNLLGQEIATLVDGFQLPNSYRVHFDARYLPSGVYLYSIQVNNFYATRKMVVLK